MVNLMGLLFAPFYTPHPMNVKETTRSTKPIKNAGLELPSLTPPLRYLHHLSSNRDRTNVSTRLEKCDMKQQR